MKPKPKKLTGKKAWMACLKELKKHQALMQYGLSRSKDGFQFIAAGGFTSTLRAIAIVKKYGGLK